MSNQLLDSCKKTYDRILSLLEKKNADYAGPEEAYKNFIDPELQAFFDRNGLTNADAVEHGIRVRLKDKWSRINTLLMSQKGPAVVSESLDDTIDDAIGYLGIWKAWRELKAAKGVETSAPESFTLCDCRHSSFAHLTEVKSGIKYCTVLGCKCTKGGNNE